MRQRRCLRELRECVKEREGREQDRIPQLHASSGTPTGECYLQLILYFNAMLQSDWLIRGGINHYPQAVAFLHFKDQFQSTIHGL